VPRNVCRCGTATSQLVGRAGPLAMLAEHLEQARAGHGSVVLVTARRGSARHVSSRSRASNGLVRWLVAPPKACHPICLSWRHSASIAGVPAWRHISPRGRTARPAAKSRLWLDTIARTVVDGTSGHASVESLAMGSNSHRIGQRRLIAHAARLAEVDAVDGSIEPDHYGSNVAMVDACALDTSPPDRVRSLRVRFPAPRGLVTARALR
jgi:hypothetical protein